MSTGERSQPALTRLVLIVLGHVVVFGAVYLLTVHTVPGRELADAALRGAIAARPLLSGTVQSILNVVSVASLLGAMALVAVVALVRLARLEGLAAVGILVGANVSTWLLKNVLLTRPDLDLDEIAPSTLNSLPSGHATAAFSAVAALLFVAPRASRDLAATMGVAYAAVTGVATMLAGWHRPADAVGAFLVVGAWTALAAVAVLLVAPPAQDTRHRPRPRSTRWLTRTALSAIGLGAALVTGLVLVSLAPTNPIGAAVAFLAGSLFVAGAAAGVTVGILEVLRLVEAPAATQRRA